MVQQIKYRFLPGDSSTIIRVQDGKFIPAVPGNVDYDKLVEAGIQPAPAEVSDFIAANPPDPIIELTERVAKLEEKVK